MDPLRSEAEVDALLRTFFTREVPAELPPNRAAAVYKPTRWLKRPNWAFLAGVAAAGLILVGVHLLLTPPPPGSEPPVVPLVAINPVEYLGPDIVAESGPRNVSVSSTWESVGKDSLRFSVLEGRRVLDDRLYATKKGAYGQRTAVKWTTVTFYEPSSDEWLDSTVPELEIEIFPLEGQKRLPLPLGEGVVGVPPLGAPE
jgi:hypothetical protein